MPTEDAPTEEAHEPEKAPTFKNVVGKRSAWVIIARIYFIVAGVALLLGAIWAIREGSDTAAAALIAFGGGALIIAPFAPNIEGTLKLGSLEVPIRRRLVDAIASAPPEVIKAVLSILESDGASIEVMKLPDRYAGQSLKGGEDLQTWRPKRGLSVLAIERPGGSGWMAGGAITTEKLKVGTSLLIAGPPDELAKLRRGE